MVSAVGLKLRRNSSGEIAAEPLCRIKPDYLVFLGHWRSRDLGEDADGEQWMEISLGVARSAAASKMELRKRDALRARGAEPLARKGAEESRGCHPALHSETPPEFFKVATASRRARFRRVRRARAVAFRSIRVREPFSRLAAAPPFLIFLSVVSVTSAVSYLTQKACQSSAQVVCRAHK